MNHRYQTHFCQRWSCSRQT